MRWAILICALAFGCGEAGALEQTTDDEPQRAHVDAGARATESAPVDAGSESEPVEHWGSHTPPMLPDCVGLLPSYVDRFGEYGLEAALEAVNEWLVATGHDAGDIPVVFDASCGITIGSGDLSGVAPDDFRVHGFHRNGRITLSDAIGMGEPCEAAERGGWKNARVVLPSLLKHELGHAFGCSHQDSGLMLVSDGQLCRNERSIDAVAVACATSLNSVK